MTPASSTTSAPVRVDPEHAAAQRSEPLADHAAGARASRASRTLRVAAIIVTWNRWAALDTVLKALARQHAPGATIDVVVVDNASTDGTSAHVASRWRPGVVIENDTPRAEEPAFRDAPAPPPAHAGDAAAGHPFASLTLVRNAHNLGGCGGFNTGLALVDARLAGPDRPLDYAWLLDDDIDLPDDALRQLLGAAEADPSIGIVGSRTVDFADRTTTIESAIYFDPAHGLMSPEPAPTHRLAASHAAWARELAGAAPARAMTGVREVDVVPACSMLARWSAVREVGFWDARYFIYCDDADWCLRFQRAGHKVVCNLDAVVYHTFWMQKLTPVRGYYASRNLLWLLQKTLDTPALRHATLRRLAALLLESRKAMTHCRLFHAEIIRRSAADVIANRGGKLDDEGPAPQPVLAAMDEAGVLAPGAHVAVMCSHPQSLEWAAGFMHAVADELRLRGRSAAMPRWTLVCKADLPAPAPAHGLLGRIGAPRIVRFEPRRASKLGVQTWLLRDPPDAVVVFNQHNDAPLLWSRRNIHVDTRRPGLAQVERDGWRERAAFLARWAWTGVRALWHGRTVRPYVRRGRYG